MPEKNEKHLESMESVRWVERKKERKEGSSWVKLKASRQTSGGITTF